MAEDTHFWYGFNYTAEGWAQVSLLVIIRSKSVVNCNANVEANSIIRRPPIDINWWCVSQLSHSPFYVERKTYLIVSTIGVIIVN